MKSRRVFQLLMAILLMISLIPLYQAAPAAKAQEASPEITRDTPYMPGEIVISFAAGSSAEQNAAVMDLVGKQFGVQAVRGEAQTVLLRGDAQMDVEAAAKSMEQLPGVEFAEPNYLYWIPEPAALPDGATHETEYVYRKAPERFPQKYMLEHGQLPVPMGLLQTMQTNRGGQIQAVYPNDDYLWWNEGWSWVGADIVSSNSTASANVCEIDTGVDYLHKDLASKVIKGYDFISDDADPMDDNGHGTHVAGVIAAVKNNSEGIAGVSTGKVVAVKALTAQGWGTNYDIASAINYCANRTDVKVINMSLGGSYYSSYIEGAVAYAVNVRGKLLVAAAGNSDTSSPNYPAYFAAYSQYANKVLAVGASGYWQYDPDYDEYWLDYNCKADYSNYGSWVSVVAPGTDIYSLLPWDRPFYLQGYGYYTRYDYLSGTSMATPFVAAAAARRWGYTPTAINSDVGAAVVNSGWSVDADGTCWPTSMAGKHDMNVADLLDRGGAYAEAYDASSGTPLNGATVYIYRGATFLGSGIITPYTWKASPTSTDPNRIYTNYYSWTDIINLPTGGWYWPKLNKSGYTASPQWAYDDWGVWIEGGYWSYGGTAYVPPKSANYDLVLDTEAYWEFDFDLNVFLPNTPNGVDPGQPAPFIVGPEGDAFGYLENDPSGTLTAFPYARYRYGFFDFPNTDDTVIKKRSAHGIPANPNLPYYAGTYTMMVTDYGQTIDHDYDGCGDNWGLGWSPSYNPAADPDCPPTDSSGTLGRSLLWYVPRYEGAVSVFLWKDGVIKVWNSVYDTCGTTASWWEAFTMDSPASSTVTRPNYYYYYSCGSSGIVPYAATPFAGRMQISR